MGDTALPCQGVKATRLRLTQHKLARAFKAKSSSAAPLRAPIVVALLGFLFFLKPSRIPVDEVLVDEDPFPFRPERCLSFPLQRHQFC
jgi:hypothetical protein